MQNYKNHAKLTLMYHGVLLISFLAFLTCAIINLRQKLHAGNDSIEPWLFILIGIIFFVMTFLLRSFPLKAQDRVIRAEENMRHYVLTGKPLDKSLTMGQIISLRFASDAEFPALAQRALKENLSPKDIKLAVKEWRADNDRM